MDFSASVGANIGADIGGAASAAASVVADAGAALAGAAGAAESVAGHIGGTLDGDLGGNIGGEFGGALAVGGALALGAGLGAALAGGIGGGFHLHAGVNANGSAGASLDVGGSFTGLFGARVPKASQKLVKALFVDAETPPNGWHLECLFNPYHYTVEKRNQWPPSGAQAGAAGSGGHGHSHMPGARPAASTGNSRGNLPQSHFAGGGAITIDIPELWFDTALTPNKEKTGSRDVRDYTDKLLAMMMIDPKAKDSDLLVQPPSASGQNQPQGRPHMYMFVWGNGWSWKCVVMHVTIDFTLFDPDGTPTRAKTHVTLQQVQEGTYKRQNPTSGGEDLRASRVVQPGDTLDLIAYQEYGDPTLWRTIARANRLEDPRSLRAGQRLVVPVR